MINFFGTMSIFFSGNSTWFSKGSHFGPDLFGFRNNVVFLELRIDKGPVV